MKFLNETTRQLKALQQRTCKNQAQASAADK